MKGADQCPRCSSRRWADVPQDVSTFYAATLRVCGNCATAWEPFAIEDLPHGEEEPLAAFKHPCNNCAFRKGSPEQADREGWQSKLYDLDRGATFNCHKGVPIEPSTDHGFAYPHNPDGTANRRKLRLCRGYLNSIVGPRLKELAPTGAPQAEGADWIDPIEEPWSDDQ